jgi:hypothetical protein
MAGMSVQEVSYFGDVDSLSKTEDWQLWKNLLRLNNISFLKTGNNFKNV